MAKYQVPTVGGLRKVIRPGSTASSGTTIAGLEGTTLTIQQLAQLLANLTNTGGGNIGTGAEAAIQVGPGLSGGGSLVGVVTIRLTAPAGAFGIVAEDGADGDMGPPGPPGAAGARGAIGPVGPQGDDGADGDIGPPGAPGVSGAPGATGAPGPAGPVVAFLADDGADGDLGPPGPPGPLGATGATGSTGLTGGVGPTGPVVAFLADDGADGDLGPPGPPGPLGATGATGTPGSTGAPGAAGPALFITADDGADGDLGPPGPPGLQGAMGATGSTGATGGVGAQGPAIFFLADDGSDGDIGVPGVAGATGHAGPAGGGSGLIPDEPMQDDGMITYPYNGPVSFVGPSSFTYGGNAGNAFPLTVRNTSLVAGNGQGLLVEAGTSNLDAVVSVVNASASAGYFVIFGDGSSQLGPATGTRGITISTQGALTVLTPSSNNLNALYVSGATNAYAIKAQGALTTGQSLGLLVQAGFSNADAAFALVNALGNQIYCEIFGDGSGSLGPQQSVKGCTWATSGVFTFLQSIAAKGATPAVTAGQTDIGTTTTATVITTAGGIALPALAKTFWVVNVNGVAYGVPCFAL
jgi:hypothetical protein